MRRLTIIGAVAVASLIFAAVAVASFTQVSDVKFTTTKAGHSTGIAADIHSTTDPGQAPKAAKLVVLRFPSGTKFHLGLVKACTLSDSQLMTGKACPARSQIGSGSATASAYPLPTPIMAGVKAFADGPHKMTLVIKATQPVAQTIVVRATANGSTLSIPVPTPTVAGFKVVLVSLQLGVPKRSSGRNALITAGQCAAHSFVVKSHFVYDDGSTTDLQSTSPCS
jgi:hypothetical protein